MMLPGFPREKQLKQSKNAKRTIRKRTMMFQKDLLKDKVVLVTGGGTGLGRAMGTRFLELGAKVAIASRRKDLIEQAAAEMAEQTGGETLAVQVDVRDPAQVDAMVDEVIAHFGRI